MQSFQSILFKLLRIMILTLVLLTVILVIGFGYLENKMIFYPTKFPAGYWDTSQVSVPVEDCSFQTEDGVQLHGWFVPAIKPLHSEIPTLLFFHGNAGNITHRLDNVLYLAQLGMHVFIFDYRGYGKSQGKPDEQGLYTDALAAYSYVISRDDEVDKDRLVFFGRSLGGAVAVELAMRKPGHKLILESTFTSIGDMAKTLFGVLPIHTLVGTKFDSFSKIREIHVPLLVLHGRQDQVVPFELGERLFQHANPPKRFYPIEGADHNDTYEIGGRAYFETLAEFIFRLQS